MKRMVDDKEIRNFDDRITALEQGGVVADAYTKAQTDALLLAKVDVNKHFDDDDNPEDFYIKQPETYSSGIELHASRDDNHHPDYANVLMTPTHIVMMANSANHGDDDDDYTGIIEVTDNGVNLSAVTAQDVKTEISIDSSSAIIKSTSSTNQSTIGISGTEINLDAPNAVKVNCELQINGGADLLAQSATGYFGSLYIRKNNVDTDIEDLIPPMLYAGNNITLTAHTGGGYDINSTVSATINNLDNYRITIGDRYIYRFKDVPNYDITPTDIGAIRLIPTYAPIIDKTDHKTGYLEQGNTWITMYWADGTNTNISFVDSPTAVITRN